jgi:hypothetical protein
MVHEKEIGRTITIIEPHHDDFGLSIFGTMLKWSYEKKIDRVVIISCFSAGSGDSRTPTSEIAKFLQCETEVHEMLWKNIFSNVKEQAPEASSLEEAFYAKNGFKWEEAEKQILEKCEGTVIQPLGYCHTDHNLLSRLRPSQETRLFYREYPYWWHFGTSNYQQRYTPHLMKYPKIEEYEKIDLEKYADYKWKIVPRLYVDVWGQFNPLFAIGRPWYKSIRDEVIFKETK